MKTLTMVTTDLQQLQNEAKKKKIGGAVEQKKQTKRVRLKGVSAENRPGLRAETTKRR